nr:nickel import ATP-binding protein NikD [Paenibacillus wynnii]
MSPGAERVLEVSGLNVTVKTAEGRLPIISNIGFELKRGRVLGLVGESGSGKSVTCLSILQLLDPTTTCMEGSICLQGRELNGLKKEEVRRIRGKEIALIMQNPMNAFSPLFTIGDQFIETIRTHTLLTKKQAIELALNSLQEVNLPDAFELMRKYPFQLSGGMLQRVMIAFAMCLRPAVLIADEPTTSLDMNNQMQVLCLLRRICTEYGTSILLISHDLGVIAEMADDVAVMQHGRIVEKAEVCELFDHPQHVYTKELLDARIQIGNNQPSKSLMRAQ